MDLDCFPHLEFLHDCHRQSTTYTYLAPFEVLLWPWPPPLLLSLDLESVGLDLAEAEHSHPRAGKQAQRRRTQTCHASLVHGDPLLLHGDPLHDHHVLVVQDDGQEGETGQVLEERGGFPFWG